MNNCTIKVSPSFFDDTSPIDYTIWRKNVTLKKASEVRLLEGILFKRSARTNFWKSRYYVLFEDRLAYYKNSRQLQNPAICNVQNMRIEQIFINNEKDKIYGFRLMHNGQSCELYSRSKEMQDKWVATLSKFCVLTYYSASFVNIKVIGKGSFARVFLSKRKSNGMDFAIKTFDKPRLAASEKARASLINEINITRRLKHENILQLYEVYESENHIYLVLELLNGGELFDRIMRKGQYSEVDASILMKNLLNALNYMHSRGYMHRDIKLENLILKDTLNDWDIKIVDFGLATQINSNEQLFKRCGTPGYVAPEILEDQKYDEKVDVFSAGVILYILLVGGSPFHSNDENEILLKNRNCEINFNFQIYGQTISDSAVDLLKKMLAKNPKERISAAEALNHQWILTNASPEISCEASPKYLNLAQENMRNFKEENSVNSKRNKHNNNPNNPDSLERADHAPSPLINGRIITVADSKNSFLNSPDVRKSQVIQNQVKMMQFGSPQDTQSLNSTKDEIGENDALSEGFKFVNMNLNGFGLGGSLLSQLANNEKNNTFANQPKQSNSTSNKSMKKVLGVQGNLLKFISFEGEQQQQQQQQQQPSKSKVAETIKNLKQNI